MVQFENLVDLHTHSIHSFDGNHSIEDLCNYAVKLNIKQLAITDHCEIDARDFDFDEFCKNQYLDVSNAKKAFDGRLKVLKGIELGQAVYNKPLAEGIIAEYDYDFILGSIHNLENMQDFYFLDFLQYDIDDLLSRYFDTIIQLCEWGGFDSLAHLTYPLRYIYDRLQINVDLSKFYDKIDYIFELLISNDKALEINTSGLGMKMHDFLPNEAIISRFKRAGGKYITIGSDSHYKDRLGIYVPEGLKMAKSCGFNEIAVFENRQPTLIEIK